MDQHNKNTTYNYSLQDLGLKCSAWKRLCLNYPKLMQIIRNLAENEVLPKCIRNKSSEIWNLFSTEIPPLVGQSYSWCDSLTTDEGISQLWNSLPTNEVVLQDWSHLTTGDVRPPHNFEVTHYLSKIVKNHLFNLLLEVSGCPLTSKKAQKCPRI